MHISPQIKKEYLEYKEIFMDFYLLGKRLATLSPQAIEKLKAGHSITINIFSEKLTLIDLALIQPIGGGFGISTHHHGSKLMWGLSQFIHD